MMKQLRILLTTALLGITGGSLLGMQPHKKGPSPFIQQLDTKNKRTTEGNKAAHQNQPYYILYLMQPTDEYRTLNNCVDSLFHANKFPKGYNKTADSKWHISMIAFAVPFKEAPNREEVVHASNALRNTMKSYKATLRGITFTFQSLESIGTNKFIAAHYDFKNGKAKFLNAYAHIIDDFLQKYNQAWLLYGYKIVVPHVSVAKTSNPGDKVVLNTAKCNKINDVELLYGGRNFFVAASYYDPHLGKTKTLKTKPV